MQSVAREANIQFRSDLQSVKDDVQEVKVDIQEVKGDIIEKIDEISSPKMSLVLTFTAIILTTVGLTAGVIGFALNAHSTQMQCNSAAIDKLEDELHASRLEVAKVKADHERAIGLGSDIP